jgi:hypothetical protein
MERRKRGLQRTRKFAVAVLLAGAFTAVCAAGFAGGPNYETIEAVADQGGHRIGITLIVYDYSSVENMKTLTQAFEEGQDRGLGEALSKLKAVGLCSISGALSYDIAFIQTIATPAGRRITFITNRPIDAGETHSDSSTQSFDLAVGQFDLNDADMSKSTGFLYPASKLVIDRQGAFHYDLTGIPLALVNILARKETPAVN